MSKSGFIRKTLLIAGLTWAWFHLFLSNSQYIQDERLRWIGRIAVVAIAAWGVLTLLSHRINRRG